MLYTGNRKVAEKMICPAVKFWSDGKANPFIRRRIAGIYAIRNLMNKKAYVGSAVSIYDRLYNHVWHLENGTHKNPKLLNAWRKHKPAAFSLEVLEIVGTLNSLLEREQFWIENFDAVASGYNLSPNAGSNLGRVFGPIARKAVADAARKALADPIVKARHKKATILGMSHPEVKRKCSEHLKKRWLDPAAKSLLMNARHSPEVKQKAALRFRETMLQREQFQPLIKSAPLLRAYRVTHPDGRISSTLNLKQFCLEHSIFYSSAVHVLHGRMRHANGYVFERSVNNAYRVTHPDGRTNSILNLKRFCLKNSISYNSAMAVLSGTLRHASGYVFERTAKWL